MIAIIYGQKVRERLRRLWLHHAHQLSEFYIKNDNYLAAIKVQEKVQALFSDAEENYFTLMKLNDLLNNAAAVEEQYWLLKRTLQEHLAVEPSEEIEEWYQRWKKAKMIRIDIISYEIFNIHRKGSAFSRSPFY